MEQAQIAKQILNFQKTALDNAFNAVVLLQDQTEKMANTIIDETLNIPQEGLKALDEWTKVMKKGRQDLRKTIDDSFTMIGSFFPAPTKSASKAQTK